MRTGTGNPVTDVCERSAEAEAEMADGGIREFLQAQSRAAYSVEQASGRLRHEGEELARFIK